MSSSIHTEIINLLKPRLEELGLEEADVQNDISLLEQGILDSLSFLEFLSQIEEKYHIEFNFEDQEPTEFTSLNKLKKTILNERRD